MAVEHGSVKVDPTLAGLPMVRPTIDPSANDGRSAVLVVKQLDRHSEIPLPALPTVVRPNEIPVWRGTQSDDPG